MIRFILSLISALEMLLCTIMPPAQAIPAMLKEGRLLRFHVIAHDDSHDMQQLKLRVRDAVQEKYLQLRREGVTMLAMAQQVLPDLEEAAAVCAQAEGFAGTVNVSLGPSEFSDRLLGQMLIPGGIYPALVIRLGDAQGQNWWGLLDPDMGLQLAAVTEGEAGKQIRWDWSLSGLLAALFGRACPGFGG